jgi:hypothetical protein
MESLFSQLFSREHFVLLRIVIILIRAVPFVAKTAVPSSEPYEYCKHHRPKQNGNPFDFDAFALPFSPPPLPLFHLFVRLFVVFFGEQPRQRKTFCFYRLSSAEERVKCVTNNEIFVVGAASSPLFAFTLR